MDAEELFDIWAPADSIWSKWAKPAIFTTSASDSRPVSAHPLIDLYSWRLGLGATAAIINLPGADAVIYGLSLAQQGFQPVPLFNSINGPAEVYNVSVVKSALTTGAETLRTLAIRPDAPPAFLLDSTRLDGQAKPGMFDNRWVVFPQDFPSSTYLLAHGIKQVILVQAASLIDRDLGWVLGLWKRAGLEVLLLQQGAATPHTLDTVRKINRFDFARAAFVAGLISTLDLHRNNAGGFGSIVPVPQSGG